MVRNQYLKKSFDKIKQCIEKQGYQCLTRRYVNSKQKLDLICPRGHEWAVIYGSFKRGHRCFTCSYNIRAAKNRKKFKNIVKAFTQEGYEVLTKEYKNNRQHLRVKCPKGHITNTMTWNNFAQGKRRCSVCARKKIGKNQRTPYQQVKNYIHSEGYRLLSKEYDNVHAKLKIECPQGDVFEMRYISFQQGQRCPKCSTRKKAEAMRHEYQQVRRFVQNKGHTLLSERYENCKTKLDIRCPKGHQFQMRYNGFQQGQRCPECAVENKKKTHRQIQMKIEESGGYRLLSKRYEGCKAKLSIKCSAGHIFKMSWDCFRQGCRCPKCNTYKNEKMLGKVLKQIYSNCAIQSQDNLGFLGRLKVDYSVSALKLAFEYDGEQHFRPVQFGGMSLEKAKKEHQKQKERDRRKDSLCKKKGFHLIRIRYEEPLTVEFIKSKIVGVQE